MTTTQPTRVGVIGCGAIGRVVASALVEGRIERAVLSGVAVRSSVTEPIGPRRSVDELISTSDIVVEAAGQDALAECGPQVLNGGRDLVAVSVGALADPECFAALVAAGPGRLHLPSGAIGGLDVVRAAAEMGEISAATITSTKLPAALVQDWMSEAEAAQLRATETPLVLFDGDVRELVRRFPSSTNVAATLALAVGGWELVRGVVVADPAAVLTSHVIEVRGDAGHYRFEMSNQPSPQNPRSSAVVPWAVVRVLRDLCGRSWRVA